MANLRPGTYLLQIEQYSQGRLPWAPQWYDRAAIPEDATPITISSEGEVVRVPVVLEKGGTIRGTVRAIPDDPSVNYLIHVTTADDPSTWGRRYYSMLGRSFEAEGLPDGDWKVGAWK